MKKSILVCILVLSSASAALGLRLAEAATQWEVAALEETQEIAEPTAEKAGGEQASMPALEIQGVRTRLDLSSADLDEQIEASWEAFYSANPLHGAVNWLKPVFLYAVYSPLDGSNYELTIGYALSQTVAGAFKATIPEGSYSKHIPASLAEDDIRATWQDLYESRLHDAKPSLFLERYQLDGNGGVREVSLWVEL